MMNQVKTGGTSILKKLPPKSSFLWYIGFIALAIGLSATKISFLTPLILIGLMALILPYRKWGIITRLVISGLLLFVVNTVLAIVLLALKQDVAQALLLSSIWGGLLLAGGGLKRVISGSLYTPSAEVTKEDLICLSVATLAGLTVYAPFLFNHLRLVLQIASNSGDNLNHMELIKAVVHMHGYFQGSRDTLKNIISPLFFGYPLGWHVNVVMLGSFWPTDLFRHTFSIIYLYYGAFALTAANLVYMFCLLAIEAGKAAKQNLKSIHILAAGLFALSFWALWMFDFVIKGFPNYLMVLTLFELLLFFLYDYLQASTATRTLFSLATVLLTLSAIGTTWLFLLPPAALLALAAIIFRMHGDFKKDNFLFKWLAPQLAIGLLSLPILLFQPSVQLSFAGGSAINASGNINHLDTYIVAAFSIAAMVVVLFYRKSLHLKKLGTALVVTLLYAGVVSAYQHATIGHQEYYFYKALFAVLLVVLLIFTPVVFALSDQVAGALVILRKSLARWQWYLVIAGIGIISLLLLDSHGLSQLRHFRHGEFDDRIDDRVAQRIAETPLNGSKLPPIFIGACNHANDYLATHLVSTLSDRSDAVQQSLYFGGLFATDKAQMIDALRTYHAQRGDSRVTIVSLDPGITQDVRAQLGTQGIDYIDVIDGQSKDISHCPNFVNN